MELTGKNRLQQGTQSQVRVREKENGGGHGAGMEERLGNPIFSQLKFGVRVF